jgi:hypothetical protein
MASIAERIDERARAFRPSRFLKWAVVAVPLALGWLAGLVVRVVWFAGAWAVAAFLEAFKQARGSKR